ncbi:hypothetical protein BGZ89_000486 [Linnemannia elongata]|nr:hypothetical protein BGZ89_000486 [Linnemannia elongata]
MSDSSAMVSITAANTGDTLSSLQDTPKPSSVADNAPTKSTSSSSISAAVATATATPTTTTSTEPNEPSSRDEHKDASAALPPKPPTILLPPVEIEERPTSKKGDDNNKENIDPLATPPAAATKPGVKTAKPATGVTSKAKTGAAAASATTYTSARKPLTAGLLKATTATTAAATGSSSRVKPTTTTAATTSSTTRTPVKPRPAIPTTLRSAAASTATSATSSTRTPSSSTSTTTAASRVAAARTLAPPAPSTVRRSPSTPSLSSSTRPAISSATRRVASSSEAVPTSSSSPQSGSPSSTPGPSRSASRASIASSAITNTNTSTARRPLTSSSATTPANRTTTSRVSAPGTASSSTASTTRRTPSSSTNPSPTSTLRSSSSTSSLGRSSVRPTGTQSTTPTPIRKTLTSASTASTSTRPVTDATKVKMLSSQLSGLQEKHDQTLKLLQEQEERLKRELEELSTISSDQQRKPIPSDTQDVLQEMEDLRKQFQNAKEQHEKALEDIAAERALEISQLKESHEALLLAMTQERDTVAESLKVLKESGELTEQEKNDRIKSLEEQMENALQSHTEAVAEHAAALETLRDEIEAAWNLKLESRIQALEKEHKEKLGAAEENIEKAGHSSEEAIQQLKDSFAEQIKDLEDEKEARILELIAQHEAELQAEKDKFIQQADAHEELIAHMKDEHEEVVGKLKIRLESTEDALGNAQSELIRVQEETQVELKEVRQAMEEIRKLLALKETESADLERRIQELTDDLENASLSAMLKNDKKYKVKLVQIFGSTVSGNLKIKRAQKSIGDALEQLEIEYEFVDVSSSDEAKNLMRRKNGGETQLPQIFSGGEYRGLVEDFEYAIETHQLTQFLGFDRTRAFVPQKKVLEPSALSLGAQDGEDAEQGAGLPDVVVNGLGNRVGASPGTPGTPTSSGRLSSDLGTSMYLLSPSSNRFQSTSSLASNSPSRSHSVKKAGFVQAAGQAWDGALKEDVTRAKHDLGFNSTVTPDDDELEELFQNGAVSEADLEAMLESVRI